MIKKLLVIIDVLFTFFITLNHGFVVKKDFQTNSLVIFAAQFLSDKIS